MITIPGTTTVTTIESIASGGAAGEGGASGIVREGDSGEAGGTAKGSSAGAGAAAGEADTEPVPPAQGGPALAKTANGGSDAHSVEQAAG